MHHTQLERTARYRQTPKGQFTIHKSNARRRGIDFQLTFEQWWNVWRRSGHWDQRGNRRGAYVMSRHGDVGAYAVGNVSIIPFCTNAVVSNKTRVRKRHTARTTTVMFDGTPVPPVTYATRSG